jgi:aminoglycoside phosphotransferase (APT) family kinase protein
VSDAREAMTAACKKVGLDPTGAELIRVAENTLYRLPGAVVARVTRADQAAVAAAKELRVSRWLGSTGVPVVEALPAVPQPVEVDGRAVTFWRELPPHQEGSIEQVADVLRRIHRLQPPPDINLPPLDPFVRLDIRIAEATVFGDQDRSWLLARLDCLADRYAQLPTGLPRSAVHGDAWGGNIVATDRGPVVLDLERFAFGPPEWDLASIAVDYFTFGSLSRRQWTSFCERYGLDVSEWPGYPILRDARELRKVTFAGQMATQFPHLREHARHRLACISGKRGPRPWYWTPVP